MTEANGQRPPAEVEAIFIVAVMPDGGSHVILDASEQFTVHRQATPNDVYPACANIVADWAAMKNAEAVVSFQAQLARQAADQAMARRQSESES